MKIGELSQVTGVKPGTIRFYEKLGFIEPAQRLPNNYRIFTTRHIYQVRICQMVFGGFINKRLRKVSLGIVEASRNWDMDAYDKATKAYQLAVEEDIAGTKRAIASVMETVQRSECEKFPFVCERTDVYDSAPVFSKKQAAKFIGTTQEAIRNWERNGLLGQIEAYRRRFYTQEAIERMYLIRLLLDTGYSMMAIKSFLGEIDSEDSAKADDVLIHPGDRANLIYRADRYLETLLKERENAQRLCDLLQEMHILQGKKE